MRAVVLVLVALLALIAACGGGGSGDGNLFVNPGFEGDASGAPWFSLDEPAWGAPFSVSDRQAHEGGRSALLELRPDGDATSVVGVVQELAPGGMPELLSGAYYVERWEPGTPKQYVQAVVIVIGAENAPEGLDADNYQLRYVLAGVDQPPLELGNARFVLPDDGAIQPGRWLRFELDLHADFERLWAAVPAGFTGLRVLFEVRWDNRVDGDGPAAADVYFDDLYLGPR